MFYHSLVSDWNHGNAHFLRGVASELQALGHDVIVYEPEDGWSRRHLLEAHGPGPSRRSGLAIRRCVARSTLVTTLDLDRALAGADVVIAHEWNHPDLIAALGAHRLAPWRRPGAGARLSALLSRHPSPRRHGFRRPSAGSISATMTGCWHSAESWPIFTARADGRTGSSSGTKPPTPGCFIPALPTACQPRLDVVWIGNWGDDERAAELQEFLLGPVRELGLNAEVWGVRYPESALQALERAGIRYRGWLPNFEVPAVFAAARLTVHVPRAPLRTGAGRHTHHSPVRGDGLRHPADLGALARQRGTVPGGRGLSAGARWTADGRAHAGASGAPGDRTKAERDRTGDLLALGTPVHIARASSSTSRTGCGSGDSTAGDRRRLWHDGSGDEQDDEHDRGSGGAAAALGRAAHGFLRVQPGVRLLERRRHVLPGFAGGARRAWSRHHVLRTGRLRAPAPPRHRGSALGQGGGLSRHGDGRERGASRRPPTRTCW